MTPMPEHLPTDSDRANACTTGSLTNHACQWCRAKLYTRTVRLKLPDRRTPEAFNLCDDCEAEATVRGLVSTGAAMMRVRVKPEVLAARRKAQAATTAPATQPKAEPVKKASAPEAAVSAPKSQAAPRAPRVSGMKTSRQLRADQARDHVDAVVRIIMNSDKAWTAGELAEAAGIDGLTSRRVAHLLRYREDDTIVRYKVGKDYVYQPSTRALLMQRKMRAADVERMRDGRDLVRSALQVLDQHQVPMTAREILDFLDRSDVEPITLSMALKREKPKGLIADRGRNPFEYRLEAGTKVPRPAKAKTRKDLVPKAPALKPEADDDDLLTEGPAPAPQAAQAQVAAPGPQRGQETPSTLPQGEQPSLTIFGGVPVYESTREAATLASSSVEMATIFGLPNGGMTDEEVVLKDMLSSVHDAIVEHVEHTRSALTEGDMSAASNHAGWANLLMQVHGLLTQAHDLLGSHR